MASGPVSPVRTRKRLFQFQYPNLAIACLPRPSHVANRFHHLFRDRIIDRQFDLRLGQKIDAVFGAAINLRMSMLPP
jgi:hypothetical protein